MEQDVKHQTIELLELSEQKDLITKDLAEQQEENKKITESLHTNSELLGDCKKALLAKVHVPFFNHCIYKCYLSNNVANAGRKKLNFDSVSSIFHLVLYWLGCFGIFVYPAAGGIVMWVVCICPAVCPCE